MLPKCKMPISSKLLQREVSKMVSTMTCIHAWNLQSDYTAVVSFLILVTTNIGQHLTK
jgi:hypothetical protein